VTSATPASRVRAIPSQTFHNAAIILAPVRFAAQRPGVSFGCSGRIAAASWISIATFTRYSERACVSGTCARFREIFRRKEALD
jgi:hypothetical protein